MVTSEQIRAARALLRIEQADLARCARVSTTTIRRLEARGGAGQIARATVEAVQRALEQAGAEFIENGVRVRRPRRRDPDALYRDLRAIAERSAARQARLPPFTEADLYDAHGLPA